MVDFSNIIDLVAGFASVIAIGVVGWALTRGMDWLRKSTPFGAFIPEAAMRVAIYEAIEFGIGAAKFQAQQRLGKIEFDNEFLEFTARYIRDSVPQYLEEFGVTPERLTEMIKARLGELVDG